MQENWLALAKAFNSRQSFVLATIIKTQGPTYRKAGTMMLIAEQGECTGLLSGGCLEADIALHAKEVLQQNKVQLLYYDLKADAELLWGLGLGCDGIITLLLQPLTVKNNHLEFGQLLAAINKRESGVYRQSIPNNLHLEDTAAEPSVEGGIGFGQFIPQEAQSKNNNLKSNNLTNSTDKHLSAEKHQAVSITDQFIDIKVTPPISVTICGAGPDAQPLVAIAAELGWRIHLIDHRNQYLNQDCFKQCQHKQKLRAEHLSNDDLAQTDALVVMSHNLVFDSQFLANGLRANISYIGLLGPASRRDKIFKELGICHSDVQGQVYGPIGLAIGGRSPQAIALSIVAQIQQHFHLEHHPDLQSK